MEKKLKVGLIGGTGLVGQRLVSLLHNHPWFEIVSIAASEHSAGKTYQEAVGSRWKLNTEIPVPIKALIVKNAADVSEVSEDVDFVFCAVDMAKEETKLLEERYAQAETPVISCNSANRLIGDIPMIIPELNPEHIQIIEQQRKRLGTKNGFIVVKPNCSIQSYVPPIHALLDFKPKQILACTYQAISGAGKNFEEWPEMVDNVIPYIGGEEDKSENEPLKIWGRIQKDAIVPAENPVITTQCIRIPVTDGHLAAVFVSFEQKPSKQEIIDLWSNYQGKPQILGLPNAPKPFMKYFEEENRPQTKLDRDFGNGMGVTMGRLREDKIYDYKFICLSHNVLRGAAGGAVLIAELLKAEGYLQAK
ncbi:MAG: aspartate-semialdehyde dehydrogenase [Peptococcaceae bacterium]|jgi:aspartate-semialdehyde dehydrogenase|nr:aspartate-semialdehyde dehydrogenase [Peptococcaceae bacterium]